MSTLKIVTNNQFRPVVNAWELSQEERKQFDYLDWSEVDNGNNNPQFIRYKGELYALEEFVRLVPRARAVGFQHGTDDPELLKWDGIKTDSYFSGLLVKYSEDYESVKIGFYTC